MKSSLKEKLFLITFAAMVLLVVLNIDAIYGLLLVVLGAMNPLFVGGLLAFVLNVPMKKLEDLIEKVPFLEKKKRLLALIGVLIGFALIVAGVVMIVLPTLAETISQIVTVTQGIPKMLHYLNNSGILSDKWVKLITGYETRFTDWSNLSLLCDRIPLRACKQCRRNFLKCDDPGDGLLHHLGYFDQQGTSSGYDL